MASPRPVIFLTLTVLILGLFRPEAVLAAQGEYPSCAPNSSCVIGEFLYDDNYAPIATADCRLTSRDPSGDLFVNSATMSAQTDGWYSFTASTGAVEGVYRSQICRTAGNDYLCLDKTFQVKHASSISAADIWNYSDRNITNTASVAADVWTSPERTLTGFGSLPSDIWNYSGRTLTGFGSLVADVWNYSSKSLSNFGDLVSSIWNHDNRTITGDATGTTTNTYNTTNNNSGPVTNNNSGNITNNTNTTTNVTNQQITDLLTISSENRKLLEQIVNKPVVKNFIDEGSSLQSKLEKSNNLTFQLHSAVGDLKSRSELLDLHWSTLTPAEIQTELSTINKILKEDQLQEDSSIIATTDWLKNNWNSTITLNLADQADAAQSKIQNLITDLSLFGKSQSPLAFKSALTHIQNLDTLVGTSLNTANDTTLNGYLKKITQLSAAYDLESKSAVDLLANLDTKPVSETTKDLADLSTQILATNQLPSAVSILDPVLKEKDVPRNRVLSLLALVNTNISLLAGQTGKVVNQIWLEDGSIVFRAVVTNPSQTLAQKIPVEIYLPEEIKKEQIIQTSPELKTDFNQEDNRMWATGEITLAPLETRTFFCEVTDIWKYAPEEVAGLKNQVEELNSSLKNTAFSGQGTSLKTDITVALDKVLLRQKEAITPDDRIKTYRESQLDMVGIAQKIDALKLLITQANANSSIFGFVGGVQAVAVWGLIIILIAGFVFLTLYMRTLRLEQLSAASLPVPPKVVPFTGPLPPHIPHRHAPAPHRTSHRLTILTVLVLLTGGFGSLAGSTLIKRSRQKETLISPLVSSLNFRTLGASTDVPQATTAAHLMTNPVTPRLNK